MKDKIQVFIHKWYDTIKLALLILVVILLLDLRISSEVSNQTQSGAGEQRLRIALAELKRGNAESQKKDEEAHAKTQRFILCIYRIHPDDRTDANLQRCTEGSFIDSSPLADDQAFILPSQQSRQSQPRAVVNPADPTRPQRKQPTTSEPPEPGTTPSQPQEPTLGRLLQPTFDAVQSTLPRVEVQS